LRVVLLTAAALVGFAANSLLTRSALGAGRLDPASFTLVRVATGALTLALLARARSRRSTQAGSWPAAAALAAYAVFFTLAYTRIGAGVGALLLFGSVQVTMIVAGLLRGERPARIDWVGLTLACIGLLILTVPGSSAPDLLGSGLMLLGGICWGAYSLAGRSSRDPLGATAGNFLRAMPGAIALAVIWTPSRHITTAGLVLAAASGSLASGVGYTFWYAALPSLAAWRAAVVQLIVPVLTAIAAAVLLNESIGARLMAATALVAAGVWLTIWPAFHTSEKGEVGKG
jgi:drug/metabolite transporter (DMT)-like permease